jgi:site-specific DNA-methyltransferase (adenine-specific)
VIGKKALFLIKNKTRMSKINFYNIDNIEFMKTKPDIYYDLAIVDPPYGIDINNSGTHFKEKYDIKDWDKNTPTNEYFEELKRVSKNQIIWGGNYFLDRLGNCKCYIIWDKKIAEDMSFAMCEMAWTSFKNGAKIYKQTAMQQDRIHPTQKPIDLYRWTLKRYAIEGDKILDTHGGSFTNAIACDMENYDLDICEIDKTYFNNGVKAFNTYKQQLTMF